MGLDESLLRSIVGGGSSESCHRQGQTTLAAHNLAAREHFKLWLVVPFSTLRFLYSTPLCLCSTLDFHWHSVTKCSAARETSWEMGIMAGGKKKKSNPTTEWLRKHLEHLQHYSVTKYRVYVIDLIINTRPLMALPCWTSPRRKTRHSAMISQGKADHSQRVHKLFLLKSMFTTWQISD